MPLRRSLNCGRKSANFPPPTTYKEGLNKMSASVITLGRITTDCVTMTTAQRKSWVTHGFYVSDDEFGQQNVASVNFF